MKGAQREPSFLTADHPSDPERKYEGNPTGAQLFCRGPTPSAPGPRKKET